MTTAVYYRVSTEDQTIDMQKLAVERWLIEKAHPDKIKIYADLGISGAKDKNRPGYQKMLRAIDAGTIQTVIVYKLDRLTRNAHTAISLILKLDKMKVDFIAVSQPQFSVGTPFRYTILSVFADLAQMERDVIVERVKMGMAAAVKRGVKLGAPIKVTPEATANVVRLRGEGKTMKEIAVDVKLSVGSVHKICAAYLNANNIEDA